MVETGCVPEVETIGQRVKRERLARNMTQRQLADEVQVGVPHISKMEAGRENPSDELLERLAEVFSVEADELLIAARRLPQQMIDELAADPAEALIFLRSFRRTPGEKR